MQKIRLLTRKALKGLSIPRSVFGDFLSETYLIQLKCSERIQKNKGNGNRYILKALRNRLLDLSKTESGYINVDDIYELSDIEQFTEISEDMADFNNYIRKFGSKNLRKIYQQFINPSVFLKRYLYLTNKYLISEDKKPLGLTFENICFLLLIDKNIRKQIIKEFENHVNNYKDVLRNA